MVNYIKSPSYKKVANFGGITPAFVKAYTPILTFWGAAALLGVFTFTEAVPLFQATFYSKIPYFGARWQRVPDPQDVPQ